MRRVILSYKMVNEHICTNVIPGLVECGMNVEALRCAPSGPRSGYSMLRIQGPPELCETKLANIDEKIGDWCTIKLSKNAPGDYIALVSNSDCDICHIIAESGCFVESARAQEDGAVLWIILGPDVYTINSLVEALKKSGRIVNIHSTRVQDSRSGLTYHQARALRIAFEEGYYDIPRRTTLEDISPLIGCSKSTLNIILRRAERKVLAEHLLR